MKALKQWQHPDNQDLYIKGFKINIKNLLSESGAGVRMVLVKGVKMMEAIFEGEYADA